MKYKLKENVCYLLQVDGLWSLFRGDISRITSVEGKTNYDFDPSTNGGWLNYRVSEEDIFSSEDALFFEMCKRNEKLSDNIII